MIRVLHIIKSLGRGGAETLLPETLKLHDKREFEFHCIYFLPWKNQMVEAIEMNGGRVTCLPAANNLQIILKLKKITKYVQENNIDIVHCHLPWAGIVGRLLYKSLGVPVLYTEHNKQERYHFLTKAMNRITFKMQRAVIAVSKDVADSIRKNIGDVVPVHEVSNGVNVTYFQRNFAQGSALRRQLNIGETDVVIGTIAVFRFQKRLSEWLEVIKKITDRHPNVKAIIVGDGPLKQEIQEKCRALQLESNVIFAGLQTNVTPWLSAMDIFMMSSVFEGLPIALLEAMSMECCIVSTDAGGIKEVIQSEKSGLLIPVDEWPALELALELVIADSAFRSSLARGARERVISSYGMDRMVNQLENLYREYTK